MGWKTNVGVGLLAFVVYFLLRLIIDAGEFRHLENHGNKNCTLIKGASSQHLSAEDITYDQKRNRLIGSSDNRAWIRLEGGSAMSITDRIAAQKEQGSLTMIDIASSTLDPTHAQLQQIALVNYPYKDFHPHGLYLSGNILYVINHRREGEAIDVFLLNTEGASFLFSISSTHFLALNDLTVDKDGVVYVTNWLKYTPGTFLGYIEVYGRMPWSYVVQCVPSSPPSESSFSSSPPSYTCKVLIDGLSMANGIAVIDEHLYVVESTLRVIGEYSLSSPHAISQTRSFPTISACDNLEVIGGMLIAACHPRSLTFLRYAKNPSLLSPSQVVLVDPSKKQSHVQQIFFSNGEDLSGSSGASIVGSHLYIGSVHSNGVLMCRI